MPSKLSPDALFLRKTAGKHQAVVDKGRRQQADLDARRTDREPEWGYKSIRWQPPADWGPFEVTPPTREMVSPILGIAFEVLFFPNTHRFQNRFVMPLHGYDS